MTYSTITKSIIEIIKEKVDPKQMLEFIKDTNNSDLLTAIVTASLSMGSSLTLPDIARITKVEDKHVHCIICEVVDGYTDKYKEELGDNPFLAPATVTYNDESYTLIFVEKNIKYDYLNSYASYRVIEKIYELMVDEFYTHISMQTHKDIPSEMSFSLINDSYARFYIPIGICLETDFHIDPHILNLDSTQSFIKLLDTLKDIEKPWYTNLFDYNGITAYYDDDKYPNLCYSLNDEYDDHCGCGCEDYQDAIN